MIATTRALLVKYLSIIGIVLLLCLHGFYARSQQDSCNLQLSVLTCGPGEDLYSIFGHSGVRVIDRTNGSDIVFNYGTMDFDDPSFYLKFIKGEMWYYLSVADYPAFMYEYQVTRRSVMEQKLNLSCEDKMRILEALSINAQEQNKFYNYSFIYDNCSTRIRDIIARNSKSPVRFNNILPAKIPTFRNMIHASLHHGQQHWSKLGIDLLLGANIDKKVTNEQSMFLPDYLMKGFDSAKIFIRPDPGALEPVVNGRKWLNNPPAPELSMPWFNPYLVLTVFSIILLILSFRNAGRDKPGQERTGNSRIRYTGTALLIDKSLLLVTGLLGTLMLALWIFRTDTVCQNNLNLAWALPTHAVAAFYIGKNRTWVRTYFRVAGFVGALLLLGWPWWPQLLNNSLVPVVLLLVIRCFTLSKK